MRRLRTKLGLSLLLVFALSGLIALLVHGAFQDRRIETVRGKIELLLETLVERDRDHLANELFDRRVRAIELRLDQMRDVPGILGIEILDAAGGHVAGDPGLAGAVNGERLMFRRPITAGGERQGSIVIAYTLEDIARERRWFWLLLGSHLLVVLVLVFILLHRLLTRSIVEPVAALATALRRAAEDGLGEQIPVAGPLELRELAESFNRMSRLRSTTERDLRDAELRLRRTIDALSESVLVVDEAGVVRSCNAAARALCGGEPVGRELSVALGLDPRFHGDESDSCELLGRLLRADGDLELHLAAGARLVSANATPAGALLVVVLREITAQRTMEVQLRQADKMQAVGQLAGGIAHDFNNLLGAIGGYAEILRRRLGDDHPCLRQVEAIVTGTRRAGELTQRLLSFSRGGGGEHRPCDLHEVVHEVATLLRPSADRPVELALRLDAVRSVVQGDRSMLANAVLNLGLNARDAMRDGGVVTIATEMVVDDDGPRLRLTVSDQGPGVPEELREAIFEPFFTTKEVGQGTGLGLAAVYATAVEHGGTVAVESAPGGGAAFVLTLPLSEDAVSETPIAGHPIGGRGRVLVVDDEPMMRSMLRLQLEDLGYQVAEAGDGQEALDRYAAEGADVVLLDVVMPRMGGVECFRRLRRLDPSARVVLSTGYARDLDTDALRAEGMCGFLPKPYRVQRLAQEIGDALAADPAREA